MLFRTLLYKTVPGLLLGLFLAFGVRADEVPTQPAREPVGFVDRVVDQAAASVTTAQNALEKALDLIGVRYRRGGSSPETGFDCSGYVGHVFREGLGLYLPRSSKEMSNTGERVTKNELQPGDLVFFNTMRRAFSHVGIYLGDNKFVHAPRAGGKVRVEDMTDRYWTKRYNGARRVGNE